MFNCPHSGQYGFSRHRIYPVSKVCPWWYSSYGGLSVKLMIDLFSGLGGASEAFIQDPNYSVLRYDNNPAFENLQGTTICDLLNYEIKIRHEIELIWASPPCLEFSNAYHAPKSIANREGIEYKPNLDLVKRAIEIVEDLGWVLITATLTSAFCPFADEIVNMMNKAGYVENVENVEVSITFDPPFTMDSVPEATKMMMGW